MGLYERAEEILAGPCNRSITTSRIFDCNWWWIVYRAVYLHFILKSDASQAQF
jgi:hypothetical protein